MNTKEIISEKISPTRAAPGFEHRVSRLPGQCSDHEAIMSAGNLTKI